MFEGVAVFLAGFGIEQGQLLDFFFQMSYLELTVVQLLL